MGDTPCTPWRWQMWLVAPVLQTCHYQDVCGSSCSELTPQAVLPEQGDQHVQDGVSKHPACGQQSYGGVTLLPGGCMAALDFSELPRTPSISWGLSHPYSFPLLLAPPSPFWEIFCETLSIETETSLGRTFWGTAQF